MPHPESGEIMWLTPDPRAVIPLDAFHASRSLKKTLRRGAFTVTFDRAFGGVMKSCADREDTWITGDFLTVYGELHRAGDAHSVEVWRGDALVGGTYGVTIGGAFFAESMFHREDDASKVALYHLVERLRAHAFTLLEVQFLTPHLASLGAVEISRSEYLRRLKRAVAVKARF
jgi:leucyl/phenylalanyl-tRNA--protein transferase